MIINNAHAVREFCAYMVKTIERGNLSREEVGAKDAYEKVITLIDGLEAQSNLISKAIGV